MRIPSFSAALLAQLKRHEGFYALPYLCPAGACTIGYGTNLDAHPRFIPYADIRKQASDGKIKGKKLLRELINRGLQWTMAQAEAAMIDELNICQNELLARVPQYRKLISLPDRTRADVLLNMAFNMGAPSLLTFKNTLAALDRAIHGKGSFDAVASGMLNSKWAAQVKGRAKELAEQMRTGAYA